MAVENPNVYTDVLILIIHSIETINKNYLNTAGITKKHSIIWRLPLSLLPWETMNKKLLVKTTKETSQIKPVKVMWVKQSIERVCGNWTCFKLPQSIDNDLDRVWYFWQNNLNLRRWEQWERSELEEKRHAHIRSCFSLLSKVPSEADGTLKREGEREIENWAA